MRDVNKSQILPEYRKDKIRVFNLAQWGNLYGKWSTCWFVCFYP